MGAILINLILHKNRNNMKAFILLFGFSIANECYHCYYKVVKVMTRGLLLEKPHIQLIGFAPLPTIFAQETGLAVAPFMMVKRKSEKIVVVAALETYAMMVSNII